MATVAHTYPLTMPTDPKPAITQWSIDRVVGVSRSVFTRTTYRVKHPGAQWKCTASYPRMTKAQAAEWIGFLLQLQGQFGTFNFIDYDFTTARGSITGSPTVNGASQTGNAVTLAGLTPSGTGLLLPGDPISFASYDHMHRVVTSLSADGAGAGQVVFEPDLKAAPGDGVAIQYQNVACKMMLANSPEWESDALQTFGLVLDMVECIEV